MQFRPLIGLIFIFLSALRAEAEETFKIPETLVSHRYYLRQPQKIKNTETVSFDFNNDNKTDYNLGFIDSQLQEISSDENYDSHFDRITRYFSGKSKNFKEIYIDSDLNGKVDTKFLYQKTSKDKVQVTYLHDSDQNGDYEKTQSRIFSYRQFENKPLCPEDISIFNNVIKDFSGDMKDVSSKTKNAFYDAGNKHYIHTSCFENFGKDFFLEAHADAFREGFQCLERLETQYRKKTGKSSGQPLKNAVLLQELWKHQGVRFTCNESNFNDSSPGTESDAFAYASHENNQTNNDGIKHPFVSLNPEFPPKKYNFPNLKNEKARALVRNKLKGVLFHEVFHNLGQLHGDGAEFAYTCETCCFDDGSVTPLNKELSCRLCMGDYKGLKDPRYINDIKQWSELNGKDVVLPVWSH